MFVFLGDDNKKKVNLQILFVSKWTKVNFPLNVQVTMLNNWQFAFYMQASNIQSPKKIP